MELRIWLIQLLVADSQYLSAVLTLWRVVFFKKSSLVQLDQKWTRSRRWWTLSIQMSMKYGIVSKFELDSTWWQWIDALLSFHWQMWNSIESISKSTGRLVVPVVFTLLFFLFPSYRPQVADILTCTFTNLISLGNHNFHIDDNDYSMAPNFARSFRSSLPKISSEFKSTF